MNDLVLCIIVFLSGVALSLMSIPLVRKVALHYGWVDKPNARKIHKNQNIPRLGGVGIFFAYSLVLFGLTAFHPAFQIYFWNEVFFQLYIPSLMMFALGILDDIFGVSGWIKLFVQSVAAVVAIYAGTVIQVVELPFLGYVYLGIWVYPLTWLWIVGITNAINLIDGLDGLAGGIVFIACVTLFSTHLILEQKLIIFVIAILAGSILGFLRFNFNPAKIFMGDTGSLFLGINIAIIGIITAQKGTMAVALITPIIALGLPILDTTIAYVRRILSGKSPFVADKEHIHHRLLMFGFSHRKTVVILYFAALIFGMVALVSIVFHERTFPILFILILFVILIIFSVHRLGYFAPSKNKGVEAEPFQIIRLEKVFIFGYFIVMVGVCISVSLAEIGKIIIVVGFLGMFFFRQLNPVALWRDRLFWIVIGFFLLLLVSSLYHGYIHQNFEYGFRRYAVYISQFFLFILTASCWQCLLKPRFFRVLVLTLAFVGFYLFLRSLMNLEVVESLLLQLVEVQVPKLGMTSDHLEYSVYQFISVALLGLFLSFTVMFRWRSAHDGQTVFLPWLMVPFFIYLGMAALMTVGMLMALLVAHGVVWFFIRTFPKKVQQWAVLLNGAGFIFSLIVLVLVLTFTDQILPIQDYLSLRLTMFQQGWAYFVSNPWLGMGLDQSQFVASTGETHFHAHNNFLQQGINAGIFGILVLALIYAFSIYRLIRCSITSKRLATRMFFIGILGALVAHFIYGFFDYTILDSSGGNIFWILIGMITVSEQLKESLDTSRYQPPASVE